MQLRTKIDIKSMLPAELTDYLTSAGEQSYRGDQIFRWLHKGAAAFAEMSNIPEALRIKLHEKFNITVPVMLDKKVSELDGTIKYLWRLEDGNTIESVVMEYEHGTSVCISTQVGCRMGCLFCASALNGLKRNLKSSEMLDQVLFSQLDIKKRISNVVLMGIGEPLDNFDNVIKFLMMITHPSGMNIGARHITLSTCGLIENIDKLAGCDIQLSLAVSLHAPDDETRSQLMPVNKRTGVDNLLDACGRYFMSTGRRITYEYAMIDGVNDTPRQAELLAGKLYNTGSHLNLILLNRIRNCGFKPSSPGNVKIFTGILKQKGVNFTFRRKLGNDIDASCGQLRLRSSESGI